LRPPGTFAVEKHAEFFPYPRMAPTVTTGTGTGKTNLIEIYKRVFVTSNLTTVRAQPALELLVMKNHRL
jgi:hypothetical protein